MKINLFLSAKYDNTSIQSELIEINSELLDIWLLNRVKIPNFNSSEEMKQFIVGLNLLIEPIMGGIVGPVGYFYNTDLKPNPDFFPSIPDHKLLGEIKVETTDGKKIELEIKRFNSEMPSGNQELFETLSKTTSIKLKIGHYCYYWPESSNPDNEGLFTFPEIKVEHFISFITAHHLKVNDKNELDWYKSNTNDKIDFPVQSGFSSNPRSDEHWCFEI